MKSNWEIGGKKIDEEERLRWSGVFTDGESWKKKADVEENGRRRCAEKAPRGVR